MRTLPRASINPAAYNPRTIDRHARKKLRESIERDGLVETLVWNGRTGNLVSGHQRLAILDDEAAGEPYSLDVAVVDLPPDRERELNVRLNNPSLSGSYDFDALEKLLADASVGLDARAFGFDMADLKMTFPSLSAGGMFDPATDKAADVGDAIKAAAAAEAPPPPTAEEQAAAKVEAELKKRAENQEIGRKKRESAKEAKKSDTAEYYFVVVGSSQAEVDEFLEKAGLDKGERFHDVRRLASGVNVELGGD